MSYVGMIIHSTTLDTETKVIAIYSGTTWIQHSGYFLRGASSNVVANNAQKTGGNDNAIVPYHNHTTASSGTCTITSSGAHTHSYSTVAAYGPASPSSSSTRATPATGSISSSGAHTHTVPNHTHTINYAGTNGNTTNANIPNYKSVYIWERTA